MYLIEIERDNKKSLTEQIYERLRWRILNNSLKENEKLPSSRELANTLGVSRNIVLEAYHQLESEGYIYIKERSGTFVASGTSISQLTKNTPTCPMEKTNSTRMKNKSVNNDVIDFKAGNPAMDHFPRKIWGKLAKEVCIDMPDHLFGYQYGEGITDLQEELALYLNHTRGVICEPQQIVITSGATQALSIITKMLRTNEEPILVEDPVTDEMRNIFIHHGATVSPVETDEQGIIPSKLPKERPSFLFVIPSHQFPLGGTLSIQRRIELIRYVERNSCYIVEDDYDSEFTYEGSPVRAIQGLAPNNVIYVGTFSKILSPALRLGYVVLPYSLIEQFQTLKWYSDRHNSSIEQLVLTRFMQEGYFLKHIRKMKRIYQKRRKMLVDCLRKYFDNIKIIGQNAGMHLVVEFNQIEFTDDLIQYIYERGAVVYPVEQFTLHKGKHTNKLVLGYGSLTDSDIREGVHRLYEALLAIRKV